MDDGRLRHVFLEQLKDFFLSSEVYDASGNLVGRGKAMPNRLISWEMPPNLKLERPFRGFLVIDGSVGEVVLIKQGASDEEACNILSAKADPSSPAEWTFRLRHYLQRDFVATCDPWGWRRILESLVMTSATARTPAVAGLVAKCKALGIKLGRFKSKIDGTNQYYLGSKTSRRALKLTELTARTNVRRAVSNSRLKSETKIAAGQQYCDPDAPNKTTVSSGGLSVRK